MDKYIKLEDVVNLIRKEGLYCDTQEDREHSVERVRALPSADVRPVPEGGIGEMSDGYHTFNGLYYQRMVLFSALVNAYRDKAWKSWKHEDGKPCFDGGWFIVGIDTPQGSYTYHYEDKYWNWFECEELPVAKHWDGHTEENVTRLLSLDVRPVVHGKWITREVLVNPIDGVWRTVVECSECNGKAFKHAVYGYRKADYCHHCGADMRENQSLKRVTGDDNGNAAQDTLMPAT